MDWLIVAGLAALVLALFGDIVLMLLIRLAAFAVLLALAFVGQRSVAGAISHGEWLHQPLAIQWTALIVVLAGLGLMIRGVRFLVHSGRANGDWSSVIWDVIRVGLAAAIVGVALATAWALTTGQAVGVSGFGLASLVGVAVVVDICCPRALHRVASWF